MQGLYKRIEQHIKFLESVAYATENLNKNTDLPHSADYYAGKAAAYRMDARWLREELEGWDGV